MPQGSLYSRLLRLVTRTTDALRVNDWTLNQIDPDGLRYVATISIRGHWFVAAIALIELVYRPLLDFGVARYSTYVLLMLALIAFNGYLHHRLLSNRPITWHWLVASYVLDVFLISAVAALSDGFNHGFVHLFYYPALAWMAVLFNSFRLNMLWVTMVSVVYVAISLTVEDGISVEARDEKALLARIAVMYVVVAAVNLATRFERIRWRQAVERERALQNERVELSQAIHDTTAQSAYMVGLGIDTARALAGDSNPELNASLEATSRLARSIIWELRHPNWHGERLRGQGAGPGSQVARNQLWERHLRASRDDSVGSRAAAVDRDKEPALLHSAQRTHQRIPPRGGQQGGHRPATLPRAIFNCRCRTMGSDCRKTTRSAVTASGI